MNHPLIASLIAVLASHTMSAQPGHIEVSVTDTMHLAPTSIVFRIAAGKPADRFWDMAKYLDEDEMPTPATKPADLDVVFLLLKKNKFHVEWEEPRDYRIGTQSPPARALLVNVDSELHARRLIALLQNTEGIHGGVHEVRHESGVDRLDAFHKRLIQRARAEAEALAKQSGIALGPIRTVSEVPPAASNDYMDWMNTIMRMAAKEQEHGSADLHKTVTRTLQVRFATEP
jgi:hypothetical protein